MKRLLILIATACFLLFFSSGVSGGHSHHCHYHSGFSLHLGLGHGLHHYHRSYCHYPYYGLGSYYSYPRYYSYYPRYRTYSYYRSPTYCSPLIIQIQPCERPKVEPAPPVVPGTQEALPTPDSTRYPDSSALFTALSSRRNGSTSAAKAAQEFIDSSPDTQLGLLLSVPASRPILSDDEVPWVVDESSVPDQESNATKLAARKSGE